MAPLTFDVLEVPAIKLACPATLPPVKVAAEVATGLPLTYIVSLP